MRKGFYCLFLVFGIFDYPLFGQSDNNFENYGLPKLIPFENKGKYGYCNEHKETKIDFKFDMAYPFNVDDDVRVSPDENAKKFSSEDFATVIIKNKKYRIDSTGRIVYTIQNPGNYDVAMFPRIYFEYQEGNLKGMKYKDSVIVVKARYEEIFPITDLQQNKPFIAKLNGKYGIVDKNGVLVDFKYDKIKYPFYFVTSLCPLLIVERNKRKFYIDFKGNEYCVK